VRDLMTLDAQGRLGDAPSPFRLASATFLTVILFGVAVFLIGRVEASTPTLLIAAVGVAALSISVGFAVGITQYEATRIADEATGELLAAHAAHEAARERLGDQLHDARAMTAAMGAALHALERNGANEETMTALGENLEQLRLILSPGSPVGLAPAPVEALYHRLDAFASLHGIDLRRDPSANLGLEVVTDLDEATAILRNLVDNARKYAAGSPVVVGCEAAGPYVRVTIDDAGPGIPAHDVEALFQPGIRSGGGAQGYGAGLAIARRKAEEMRGALWYEPRSGGGSRFVLKLPRHVPTDESPPA
jgi:signal transduction histidine kinase